VKEMDKKVNENIYNLNDSEKTELFFYLIGYIEASIEYTNDEEVKPSELIKKINKKILEIKEV